MTAQKATASECKCSPKRVRPRLYDGKIKGVVMFGRPFEVAYGNLPLAQLCRIR